MFAYQSRDSTCDLTCDKKLQLFQRGYNLLFTESKDCTGFMEVAVSSVFTYLVIRFYGRALKFTRIIK